ncbi:MAG: hypothetical protein U0930_18020 [Pirellulales bacterium]
MTTLVQWKPDSICLRSTVPNVSNLAEDIYERTCRTTFDFPGFCLLNLGKSLSSNEFRQVMVELKNEMSAIHQRLWNEQLVYLSAARFDQQESTKPHLDGGPDECFLMLGYEPSPIRSAIEITDYTKCAFELGLTPKELLAKHNPMFKSGAELLQPYVTRLPCFVNDCFQIVFINNSCAPFSESGECWQGTLHTANIATPDESKRRVINSTMIARAPAGTVEQLDSDSILNFVCTSEVKRRGYDKRHLHDDV